MRIRDIWTCCGAIEDADGGTLRRTRSSLAGRMKECNRWAEVANGSRVRASDVQGATSYTMVPVDSVAGSVVQFRSPVYGSEPRVLGFRRANLRAAIRTRPSERRHAGHAPRLYDGQRAREQLRASGCRLLSTTVQDLAR